MPRRKRPKQKTYKGRIGFVAMETRSYAYWIRVSVRDQRWIYGRTELKIEPIDGVGSGWVNLKKFHEQKDDD